MAAARTSFRNRFSMRWGPAERCFHDHRLADALGLIGNLQLGRGAPQAFEIIKSSRLLTEYVHNEPAEIEQRPFRRATSFAMFRRAAKLFIELLFDFRADRLHLRSAKTGADDEVRSEGSHFAQIDDSNGGRFFILCGVDCDAHSF